MTPNVGLQRREMFMKAKLQAKTGRTGDFAEEVARALRRAAKDARRIARMYRTPLYVWENGRVVAKRP
jgi:hypothetical protein